MKMLQCFVIPMRMST